MGSKIDTQSDEAEKVVRDIRRATRRHFSAEDKVRIVIAGLRGEDSVAELCRKEGINQNLYYRWSKEFLKAGKKRLELTQFRRGCWGKGKGVFQMPRTHPPYAAEYRRRIVELARSGRSITTLAREFEPTVETIRQWIKQADSMKDCAATA